MKTQNEYQDDINNIKTIIFDKKGNMIRCKFGLIELINLIEERDDYDTYATFEKKMERISYKNKIVFIDYPVSKQFYIDELKNSLFNLTNADLPSLVLLIPKSKYIQ